MQTPEQVLDAYYLDSRCMLIELAATLDRLDRAVQRHGGSFESDARVEALHESLRILADGDGPPDRAERILNRFSDPID